MKKYKLTTQQLTTHNGFQWEQGVTQTIHTEGGTLCSPDVFHWYDSPEAAAMFNPIHACIANPILWECEVSETIAHDGLKGGSKSMTLTRQVPLPVFTPEERIAFAIYCAEPYGTPEWQQWAKDWLAGKNRTANAAYAAYAAYDANAAYAAYAASATARAAGGVGENFFQHIFAKVKGE